VQGDGLSTRAERGRERWEVRKTLNPSDLGLAFQVKSVDLLIKLA